MRYLINRKTNEHERYDGQNYDATKYRIVESDSEGWIKHEGNECPLPDDVRCEYLMRSGMADITVKCAGLLDWVRSDAFYSITHYRPILTEKVQEPEPIPAPQYDPRSVSFNLLERLKAAHAHAQQIPDLEAELREVLGSMGYDLVSRSPFVEPEPAVETPQDMSDWRNWRDNDLIMLKDGIKSGNAIVGGELYQITHKTKDGFWIDTKMQGSIHIMGRVGDFRFHSRPAKGEK